MAASNQDLQKLHDAVAKNLTKTIQQDIDSNIPTDAATLGAAIKFLKDNEITCDPLDNNALDNLKDTLIKQRDEQRKIRLGNAIQAAREDEVLQ